MNRILLSILLLGVAIARAQDTGMMGSGEMEVMLTAPMNVAVDAMSTSVLITWDMVEGATGYQVTIENVTDQNAQESQIVISGLMPLTMYTAMIKSTKDDMMSDASEISFTTLLAGPSNLKVVDVTETELEVMWDAAEGAISYTVVLESDADDAEIEIMTQETSARFTGLMSTTFYRIYVTAESDDGSSDAASLRTRTDGGAVITQAVWRNGPNEDGSSMDPFGGQVLVLRPLEIPRGPYSVAVTIPCVLSQADAWHGDINDEESDFGAGRIVVTQSQSWQRAKTEIGLNFEFDETINCTFGSGDVLALPRVEFGVDVPIEVVMETMEVPVVRNEWLNVPNFEVSSAGLVRVRLNQIFSGLNDNDEDSELPSKPAVYTSVIAVTPGVNCPGGITLDSAWSMTMKNVDGVDGILPGVLYFVQEGTDWYSNEAGLIYGYDPEVCSDRSELAAEVMVGGEFVEAVVAAPEADMTV